MNGKNLYCLRTLSPVHIGCGEEYEPMALVVDEGTARLISFDPLDFLDSLDSPEKDRFVGICKKGTIGSIIEIYKFMRGRKVDGREVDVCPGFLEYYRKTLEIDSNNERAVREELNRFGIERTAFNPSDGSPYIPGSAIKGALRTAYLNVKAKEYSVPPVGKDIKAQELEKALLAGGSFEIDPFRMLKVSDFHPLGKVRTIIIYAVNRKKNPSKFPARGPSQILEVIEENSLFLGSIAIGDPIKGAGIRQPLTRESLLTSTEKFYSEVLQQENGELKAMGVKPLQRQKKSGSYLLRLGRHSGAESVTIEGYRKIRIMQGRGRSPREDKQATTIWLGANSSNPTVLNILRPFGWVILQEISEKVPSPGIPGTHQ